MEIKHLKDFTGGWFVGNFDPSCHKGDFEVGCRTYRAGDYHEPHYHKQSREINLVIEGMVEVNDCVISNGSIFTIEPNEITQIKFLQQTTIVCVKTRSVPGDKFIVDNSDN